MDSRNASQPHIIIMSATQCESQRASVSNENKEILSNDEV